MLSGIDAVALHPVRNAVTFACLVAMLVPYVAGVAVARGLLDAAHGAIDAGANVYVRAERFGMAVPMPLAVREAVAEIDAVERVTPRIVSPLVLGIRGEHALLVGVPADLVPLAEERVRGRLFKPGATHEFVIGETLAAALALDVGARMPPFYRSARGERVATIVGVFPDDASPWLGRMVFTSLETAAWVANEDRAVTQLLVACGNENASAVTRAIEQLPLVTLIAPGTGLRLQATTRDELELLLPREIFHRESALQLLFMLVFAMGIPLVLVTSGLGDRGRRRETGLLRATGWRVDEILARAVVENVAVALAAASASILIAWAWLELGRGAGIAPIFLRAEAAYSTGALPYRMTPLPVLLGVTIALMIVLAGSVTATWRTASVAPSETLR